MTDTLTVAAAQRQYDAAKDVAKAKRAALVAGDHSITSADLAQADADVEHAALLIESAKRIEAETQAEAQATAAAHLVDTVKRGVTITGTDPGAGPSAAHIDKLRAQAAGAIARLFAAVAEHDHHVVSLLNVAETNAAAAREAGLAWRGANTRNGGMIGSGGPATIRCKGGSLAKIDADNAVAAAVVDGLETAANLDPATSKPSKAWQSLEGQRRKYREGLLAGDVAAETQARHDATVRQQAEQERRDGQRRAHEADLRRRGVLSDDAPAKRLTSHVGAIGS